MIAVLLANGFEEIEALTPIDVLRRAGLDVRVYSISDNLEVVGAHNITVKADLLAKDAEPRDVELLMLPGGMPGAKNLDASTHTDRFINAAIAGGGRLAAICAAPLVLGRRGLLRGKRATAYPGFENELIGATVVHESVVTDGKITTSIGMGAAMDFAFELLSLLCGEDTSERISKSIMR